MSDDGTRPLTSREDRLQPETSQRDGGLSRPVIIAIVGAIIIAGAAVLNFTMDKPLLNLSNNKPAATQPQGPTLPNFDVVRVDAKGNTVMAGRAVPGSKVVILDGEKEIGTVTADKNGEWVFTPDAPLPPGNRQLSLRMDSGGKTKTSDRVVVMSVPESGGEVLIVEQGRDGGRSRVLQGAGAPAGSLNVETADYDSTGKISLSGKAEAGATVQVYLDNEFLGRAVADDKGYWEVEAPGKATAGTHTVRVDQVGINNSVLARVEVPFPVSAEQLNDRDEVTIVRGNSLWRIARRIYGQGTMYTVIFEANKAQIKDPDMIYPGQVFTLPVKDRI
jgi:hypothetical protein